MINHNPAVKYLGKLSSYEFKVVMFFSKIIKTIKVF